MMEATSMERNDGNETLNMNNDGNETKDFPGGGWEDWPHAPLATSKIYPNIYIWQFLFCIVT